MYFWTEANMHRDGMRRLHQVLCQLYGLEDASRAFFNLLSTWIVSDAQFIQGIYDPCFFRIEGVKLLLSTDDILIFTENTDIGRKNRDLFKKRMAERFEITEDDGSTYIGVEIKKNEDNSISLSMPKKIQKLQDIVFPGLSEDEIPKCTEAMWMGWDEEESNKSPRCDSNLFSAAVGLLLFIAKVRFDSLTAISFLSTRTHCCTEMDMTALKHTTAYILFTRDLSLTFHPGTLQAKQVLTIISASDAAFRVHKLSSQSHIARAHKVVTDSALSMDSPSGFFMATSQSTKGRVPDSVAVAELSAAVEVTKDNIYLRNLLKTDIGLPVGCIAIEEDNQPVIDVSSDYTSQTKAMRHQLLAINFIKSAQADGDVKLVKVQSEKQRTNALTKRLASAPFWNDLPYIMGMHPKQAELKQIINDRVQSRKHTAFKTTKLSLEEDEAYVDNFISEYQSWYENEILTDLEYLEAVALDEAFINSNKNKSKYSKVYLLQGLLIPSKQ
jgi:hypothetical protein